MFATRRRLMYTLATIAAIFVVSLVSLGLYWGLKAWPVFGDVPLLKTPAWEFKELNQFKGHQLTLRRETEAGGALLLKRTDLETVYRYDPQSRSISAVTATAWENARGQISNCRDQQFADISSVLRRDDRDHKLFAGNREVRTAGGIALNNLTSPSRQRVAVLSAAGPAVQSILPFAGDLIYGQRYHEIISLPDAVPVGRAVRIPVSSRNDFLEPCWSADEKFVVYTTYYFMFVVVVETGV